ncbi:hypothetical protein [Helicobacter pylori]|uniref:hypothetical protein n=1 Tax=Helicobacter pylori TaxID=210 RepID=UPI0020BFC4F5|nr:hypothetical protein [Helicobacter pylori]
MLNKLIYMGATLRYLRFSLGWCGEFGSHSIPNHRDFTEFDLVHSLTHHAFKGVTSFLP